MIERDPYYQMGDYIGFSGIEKAYENELKGTKGEELFWLMFITENGEVIKMEKMMLNPFKELPSGPL